MLARKHKPEDVALSLTLAVVASSPTPLLLLDGELKIIVASLSFCDAFESDPADVAGQSLFELGNGAWDIPQMRDVMAAAASGDASAGPREMDFRRPGNATRRLIVQSKPLAYLDTEHTRIVVAVSDVTEARADAARKDQTLHQNRVLLQEVRHRVANSLQIVASLLLQNARKTESDETRGHLRNAHQRVMSVAALERLLSTSDLGDVEVHGYFTSLCESIAASMIAEFDQISLTVEGGDAVVEARVSVSLGLIVTELVINALKHAFPDGRSGKITVDYNFHGPNWVLCVRDNGIGMPPRDGARTGLGTTIIHALATQLNASVEIAPAHPGTKVSIRHSQIALVQEEPETAHEPLSTTPRRARANSGGRAEERS